ncbi:MAG: phage virion morphogenesis protein [Gammaproteobacteria bacterium]|nr:phage virion morphogenesis protein [Gammaproteobacteria bacterium]MBU1409042.1 phage virion morphogenesis protein [Gammaproteobacteria bacterium]MBU1533537.1 phage virion morphogenesis protein [Gammaproteobacteria bacterium]
MIHGMIVGDRETIAKLGKTKERARDGVKKTIVNLTLELLRRVKADKLSGQVLNVRTGLLRRRTHHRVTESGSRIEGIVGNNAEYARAHELGFKGPVSVKAHLRQIKEAWGKPLKAAKKIQVKPHTRQVELPARSFLRSALADMEPKIRDELRETLRHEMKGLL